MFKMQGPCVLGRPEHVALERELASFAKDHRGLRDFGRVEVFVFVGRDGRVQVGDERRDRQVVRVFVRRLE